jgi:hypothetical protein
LSHNCGFEEETFFLRKENIEKFMVCLLVMGHILSPPIPRIAMGRIGTVDLERLFGVTRHRIHGNNRAEKISSHLVKADFVTQPPEKWGMAMRRKRH